MASGTVWISETIHTAYKVCLAIEQSPSLSHRLLCKYQQFTQSAVRNPDQKLEMTRLKILW